MSRKGKRLYSDVVFDRVKVQSNEKPFLVHTNFITQFRSSYSAKSLIYSILYYLSYDKLVEALQESHIDYQLFCLLKDKTKNKVDEFEVIPCEFCRTKHTKFTCPKLHFMPISQHVIHKELQAEKVIKSKRRPGFVRR